MADDHQPALVRRQVVAQPDDGVGVEVVGGLVQQQGGVRPGRREEDAGQLDPPALTAGQRAQRLLEDPLGEPEAGRDRGGLALGGVPAGRLELLLEARVAAHRALVGVGVGAGHLALGGPHRADHHVQAARGQDPVVGEDAEVTGARVLRQVADAAGPRDRAGRGLGLAGQHPGEGGLAGTVAADQADPVARRDPEGRRPQEQARPGAQLQRGGGDHRKVLRRRRGWTLRFVGTAPRTRQVGSRARRGHAT